MTLRIAPLRDFDVLQSMKDYLGLWFAGPAKAYSSLNDQRYHELVRLAQDDLNARGYIHRIASALLPDIQEHLGSDDVWVQQGIYLRAARPNSNNRQESVGWHRESFYGCQPQTANCWVPVLGVTDANCMRYVPDSEKIPEEAIVLKEEESDYTRGSDANKVGLLYAPKRIVEGVDFSRAIPMSVPAGSAALFSSQLIHGAAQNNTDDIRISVDFRFIAGEHLFSENALKPGYFVPLRRR